MSVFISQFDFNHDLDELQSFWMCCSVPLVYQPWWERRLQRPLFLCFFKNFFTLCQQKSALVTLLPWWN